MLWRQSTISPCASRSASISIAIAAPNGACDISSSRDHCTRTGRPPPLSQADGVERDVVGGVVPVAAGAFHVLDRDILDRQIEHQSEIGAKKINALAVRPDMDAICVHCAIAQDGAIEAWAI